MSAQHSQAGELSSSSGLGTGTYATYQDMRSAANQAAFILPHLRPGMDVLDFGCGPGSITVGLARLVAPGRVMGIDISPERLAQARDLAEREGVTNVTFEVANIHDCGFGRESFDAVFEHTVLEHVPDPVETARTVYGSLRPGGFFGARDHDIDGLLIHEADADIRFSLDTVYRLWEHHIGANQAIGKKLAGVLQEAGFQRVTGSASYDSRGTPEAVAWWGEVMARFFEDPDLRSTAVEKGWTNVARLEAISTSYRAWGQRRGSFCAQARGEAIGWKD